MRVTTLRERELRITLPNNATGRKFDDKSGHGLSHCMKAVDWIVELPDCVCFIEIKDPDAQGAREERRTEFINRFSSGRLDRDLVGKFRDSFLYEWACQRVDKPISYFVIMASSRLDAALLLTRTDDLRRRLPVGAPVKAKWRRALARGCCVFNIATWNATFPDLPLQRVPP